MVFRKWAQGVGLSLDPAHLPYIKLSPAPLQRPSFLQASCKAYSVMRRVLRPPDLPPVVSLGSVPIWHNPLFRDEKGLTYHSPNLIRRGVRRWKQLADEGVIPEHLLGIVVPTWRARYAAQTAEYYSTLQA